MNKNKNKNIPKCWCILKRVFTANMRKSKLIAVTMMSNHVEFVTSTDYDLLHFIDTFAFNDTN